MHTQKYHLTHSLSLSLYFILFFILYHSVVAQSYKIDVEILAAPRGMCAIHEMKLK